MNRTNVIVLDLRGNNLTTVSLTTAYMHFLRHDPLRRIVLVSRCKIDFSQMDNVYRIMESTGYLPALTDSSRRFPPFVTSKQDALVVALQALENSRKLREEVDGLHGEVAGIKQEVAGIKQEVSELNRKFDELRMTRSARNCGHGAT